ncbi:Fur family transcriptional regulator [Feifania hominis]|uniref:Transcriptional repressor n=1 Tax=Feifania hominis TaxID=2763660 RepID=A0A926DEW6_9FIRM|nr:transcriptional repressor [Feifania hominis]MBC8535755.1 transcriptional repressor [Feifania hominis]
MTGYAQKIYEIVNNSRNHMRAEQVFHELKKSCPRVVLATVYNNLNKLCDAGLIRRIATDGEPDRYDRISKHDHLVCKRCGKLADICFDDLTAHLQKQMDGALLSYDLRVYYLCPQCRAQESGASKTPGDKI